MAQPSIRSVARGVAGLIAVAALAGACASAATAAPVVTTAPASQAAAPSAAPPAAPSVAPTAASSAAATGVVVSMATTSLGPVLVGPNSLTLYTHSGDSATSSTCTGSCATAWPPLTVPSGSTATAGSGVTGTLATLTRADGTVQVTYDGLPLYGWQNDAAAGDVTGQGVAGFSVAKP